MPFSGSLTGRMGGKQHLSPFKEANAVPQRRIALIPAYEPDGHFLKLAEEISLAGLQLIIVDDGSGSAYTKLFQKAGKYAVILTHSKNRGKGCALKTGLTYIQEHFPDGCAVVTMDSDGQHSVRDALRLCSYAEVRPDTLILGSRALKEDVPLRSRFGNSVTRFIYRLATGLSVHDTQTGLRAFGSGLLPFLISISGQRYEYEMNVLLACARQKIPITELEIETIYMDKNKSSHFDTVKDSWRVYKEILKFSASSFISFMVDYGLYSLLLLLTGNLTVSNISARIVSATVNYTVNRKLVFQSKDGVAQSAVQYMLLAAVILAGNTLLLNVLADILGMNRYFAKLLAELLFAAISWLIQHFVIFRMKTEGKEAE